MSHFILSKKIKNFIFHFPIFHLPIFISQYEYQTRFRSHRDIVPGFSIDVGDYKSTFPGHTNFPSENGDFCTKVPWNFQLDSFRDMKEIIVHNLSKESSWVLVLNSRRILINLLIPKNLMDCRFYLYQVKVLEKYGYIYNTYIF